MTMEYTARRERPREERKEKLQCRRVSTIRSLHDSRSASSGEREQRGAYASRRNVEHRVETKEEKGGNMKVKAPFTILEQRGERSGRLFWHILPANGDRRFMRLVRILPDGWPETAEIRELRATLGGILAWTGVGLAVWYVGVRLALWWLFE
jgi:hypothetical protein